ncbi:MAG TPA: rhodanese-like domain-containing protein [Candidatus Binatia bacterium]|jgi:rhodanese-related sulfurtransferase|nr:rhodanese-like domain-containing protein [Candidatus Binatia bacterium]
MPRAIDREQVQELARRGAKLLEVLPTKEYKRVHLLGAINVPLTKLDKKGAAGLSKSEPVIVYCYDYQ